MNYIQGVQDLLENEFKMKGTDYEELLEVYGLLVLTVGDNCTNENVHDAWAIWKNKTQPNHRLLIQFNELTKEAQDLDEPYRQAIIKVSKLLRKKTSAEHESESEARAVEASGGEYS